MAKDWALLEAMKIPQMKAEFNALVVSGGLEELKPNFTYYNGKEKLLEVQFINNDAWNKLTDDNKAEILNHFYRGLNMMFPERIKQVAEFKIES